MSADPYNNSIVIPPFKGKPQSANQTTDKSEPSPRPCTRGYNLPWWCLNPCTICMIFIIIVAGATCLGIFFGYGKFLAIHTHTHLYRTGLRP